MKSINS